MNFYTHLVADTTIPILLIVISRTRSIIGSANSLSLLGSEYLSTGFGSHICIFLMILIRSWTWSIFGRHIESSCFAHLIGSRWLDNTAVLLISPWPRNFSCLRCLMFPSELESHTFTDWSLSLIITRSRTHQSGFVHPLFSTELGCHSGRHHALFASICESINSWIGSRAGHVLFGCNKHLILHCFGSNGELGWLVLKFRFIKRFFSLLVCLGRTSQVLAQLLWLLVFFQFQFYKYCVKVWK